MFARHSKCPVPGWCCNCKEFVRTDVIWQCHCYEDVKEYDWKWQDGDDSSVVLSNEDRDVFFHPFYSSGTAVVRGNTPLIENKHYYWEIKILSNLYGTDVVSKEICFLCSLLA